MKTFFFPSLILKYLILAIAIILSITTSSYATCNIIGSPAIYDSGLQSSYSLGIDVGVINAGRSFTGPTHSASNGGEVRCENYNVDYAEGFVTSPSEPVNGSDSCLFKIPLEGSGEESGIALKIWYNLKPFYEEPKQYCMEYPARHSQFSQISAKLAGNFRVELVAYGAPIRPGTLDLSRFNGNGIYWDGARGAGINFSDDRIVINSLSCDLLTPDVTVDMGNGEPIDALTTFTGKDSVSPPVPFQLNLNCPQSGTAVAITFAGSTVAGSADKLLQLDNNASGSTASGVGIRITTGTALGSYGGQVMQFNKPDTDVFHLIDKAQGQSGMVSLPFTAEYVQTTENPVTPGAADATATFKVFYP